MKKLSFLLAAAVLAAILAFALAWTFYPRLSGNADALAAAQRERAALAFLTPQVRTYLLRDDPATRILRNDCVATATAINSAREKLRNSTAADPDFEKLKTDYLKAGIAKLELVKKIVENYEEFTATNPSSSTSAAPSAIENESVIGTARLNISLLAAFLGGLLALWIAARLPTKPAGSSSASHFIVSPRLEHRKLVLAQNVVLELVPVQYGSFPRQNGERQGTISIAHPFWLGKCEVTQEQWKVVMGEENNPSKNKGQKLPVENITWDEANEFCDRVNKLPAALPPKNYHYALPLEDQWEYAAIAGGEDCWTAENADGTTHNVGEKTPNKWGFYDMRGNVSEMCIDMFVGFETPHEGRPLQILGPGIKVAKGAAINDKSVGGSTIVRRAINKNERSGERGFRLALIPTSQKP
ncbi:MAG: formylglycine-generating enzyme family protein [Puniceicoccales bacterium]|jgi:hypothetical protein|nr:formylglycine-generating enzyme family protein [Puniceicoccales bacterium]